ncbi:glycosyltransferase family 2 protein [Halothiobacillus sp. DCM-1]|uniref:glycosyltransferase family 2 protein n=1 Tax=Halothiobacillus sp. DCM-1 TaxID=3112558 RepID=UPI0032468F43
MPPHVVAVIVSYCPELESLLASVRALLVQVDHIVVVDNASMTQKLLMERLSSLTRVSCEALDENFGLGVALNMGIHRARGLNASHVLLMDQDSVLQSSMVPLLLTHFDVYFGEHPVAAIGPRFIDVNSGAVSHHVHFDTLRVGRIPCSENAPYVLADFLITSGSLIPIHVLDDIGPMDESLFIDHVDTEWCLRAKSKGYELLGDCEALMEHDLGEYRQRFWFLRWREVPVHKAFRYYYIFRNSVLLYRRKYIPWLWIRIDLIRLIQIFCFTLLFGPDRMGKIAMMFRGVRDAFLGKTGKLGSKG